VVERWEISFLVLWLLRRGFTAIKRTPSLFGTARERAELSSTIEAWNLGVLSDLLAYFQWRLVFALQRRFRHRFDRGNELMVLALRHAP
jgi:hypothetical protein